MKQETNTYIKDLFLVILAFISLFLLLDSHHHVIWLSRLIWVIFLAVISIEFFQSKDKWSYLKKHPYELISLIPINGIFQGAMIIRLLRLVVLMKVFRTYFPELFDILTTNGLSKMLKITGVVSMISAIPITYLEEGITTFAEGIWWAIVTTTTVGYGDIAPVTPGGRIIAVFLMFFGIGCIGMVTGTVATYLVKGKAKDNDKEFVKNKIDQLETLSNEEYDILLQMIGQIRNDKAR